MFRWAEAVDATDRALDELGDRDAGLTAVLQAELAVAAMHDARRAARVAPVISALMRRAPSAETAEPLAVARVMASVLSGQPAADAGPLDDILRVAAPSASSWDTRAALLWTLIVAERFAAIEAALPAMIEAASQSGSARGLIATYSSLPSKDGGVDAVATSKNLFFGGVCLIQAKRWTGLVGLESVHALTGVMADHNATTGVLVTTSWFGRASEQFAKRNRITLINGAELKQLIKEHLHRDVIPGTSPPRRLRASDNTQTGRPGPADTN